MKNKKKPIKTRDYLLVKVINGVTKAGIHKDQKKEANKTASRSKVEIEVYRCIQCSFTYTPYISRDPDETAAMQCGYCSVSCLDYHAESN